MEDGIPEILSGATLQSNCKELECGPLYCVQNCETLWWNRNCLQYSRVPWKHHQEVKHSWELAIFEKVLDDPSVYLHELQHHVFHTSGNNISTSSICRFLHQQCFSHKKLTFRAQQRSEQLREKYTEEMSLYNPETLIFVDETGCDRCAALRRYMVMPYRGNQPSVIGCLSRESGTMLLVLCAWMVCLMYIPKREQWVAMSSAILLNYASCHNCYHSMGLIPEV